MTTNTYTYNYYNYKKQKPPKFLMVISFGGVTIKGKNMSFTFTTVGQTAQISVASPDINGVMRPVEDLVYSSMDVTIATVDQLGVVTAVAIGKTMIHAVADAQVGPGVVTITGTLDIEVLAPAIPLATRLDLTAALVA